MPNFHSPLSNYIEPCEIPVEMPKPLNERTVAIQERLDKIIELSEAIFCDLYGPFPSSITDECNNPRYCLEETINQMGYKLSRLEDCLSETLKRLRG